MPTIGLKQKTKVTPALREELQALFDQFLDKPFRRANLAARVIRRIRPRSQVQAERIADAIMKEAARAGQIVRHGHLHWVRVARNPGKRQLRSDRLAPERRETVTMTVDSRVPSKYVLVDLETGDLWEGTASACWTRAAASMHDEAARPMPPVKPA